MEDKGLFNYLTGKNGVRVVECSSSYKNCSAENVLLDDRKKIWLSEAKLPQYITFDISGIRSKAKHFKCFGVDCWHDYQSNPKTIELSLSPNGDTFISWNTLHLKLVRLHSNDKYSGTQFFEIDVIPNCYQYLRIMVTETFGEDKCYINQVFLMDENPNSTRTFASPASKSPKKNKETLSKSKSSNSNRSVESHPMNSEPDNIPYEMINALSSRISILESALQEKDEKIDQLYKIITDITDKLGDVVRDEIHQNRALLQKESAKKIDLLREDLEAQVLETVQREVQVQMKEVFHDARESQENIFQTASKIEETTVRDKQKHLFDLMQKLQEKLALRDLKVNQLKQDYGVELYRD